MDLASQSLENTAYLEGSPLGFPGEHPPNWNRRFVVGLPW